MTQLSNNLKNVILDSIEKISFSPKKQILAFARMTKEWE